MGVSGVESDHRHWLPLRARHPRPSHRRTAEQRDECAPPHGAFPPATLREPRLSHSRRRLLCITANFGGPCRLCQSLGGRPTQGRIAGVTAPRGRIKARYRRMFGATCAAIQTMATHRAPGDRCTAGSPPRLCRLRVIHDIPAIPAGSGSPQERALAGCETDGEGGEVLFV